MPLRLNNTSLPPKKVPKLGGKPENTVLKVRETLAPYLQVLGLHEDIDVASFDGGDWNAIYIITSSTFEPVLFRMSLDVTVEDKLESEVATMEFVRRHTSIPVPRVYAYDPSCNNAVGSAFILLEYIKSVRYYDIQHDLTDEQQRDVGRQVAEWCYQLQKLSFDKIGSLYLNDDDFVLGPLVCDNNPNGWRDDPDTFHGPFSSEEEYYRSLWEYELHRCQDEGDKNPRLLQRVESVKELLAYLPRLAAGRDLIADPARLRHVDITENNILVDTTGRAVALIDWERANAMPSKATVPYIIEESGNPKPYHVPLKAGYYERMEELHTGYLQSVFSKQASEDSKLHLFLQESDGYIDSSIIKRHFEARGTLSLPKAVSWTHVPRDNSARRERERQEDVKTKWLLR